MGMTPESGMGLLLGSIFFAGIDAIMRTSIVFPVPPIDMLDPDSAVRREEIKHKNKVAELERRDKMIRIWNDRFAEAEYRARKRYFKRQKIMTIDNKIEEMLRFLNGGIQSESDSYLKTLEKVRRDSRMSLQEARKAYLETAKDASSPKEIVNKIKDVFTKVHDADILNKETLEKIRKRNIARFAEMLDKEYTTKFFHNLDRMKGPIQAVTAMWLGMKTALGSGSARFMLKLLLGTLSGLSVLGVFGFVATAILEAAVLEVAWNIGVAIGRLLTHEQRRQEMILEIETNIIMLGGKLEDVEKEIPERVSYSVNNLIDFLVLKCIGMIAELLGKYDPGFNQLVVYTQSNNYTSLIANMNQSQKELSAMGILAGKYKIFCLYEGQVAGKSSKCITRIGYDPEDKILYVTFGDGSNYEYHGVTRQEAMMFVSIPANAASVGEYFNYQIRPYYKSYARKISYPMSPYSENLRGTILNNLRTKDEQHDIPKFPLVPTWQIGVYTYVDEKGFVHLYYSNKKRS